MGAAIGVTRQTVAQYESKKSNRLPEQDKLIAIACHYDVTVDELLNGNLEQGKIRNILINDKAIIQKVFLGLFPYFDYPDDYPEEDKSKEFLEALEIHDRLYEDIGEDTPWNHIEEIEKLLEISLSDKEKNKIREGFHSFWKLPSRSVLFFYNLDMLLQSFFFISRNKLHQTVGRL